MVTTGRTTNWFTRPAAREWVHFPTATGARAFHQSLPGYQPTPLTSLPDLAEELGVRAVLVKDESSRLGLPAFKVLGASWAVARAVAARTGSATDLGSLRAATAGSGMRLVTATDGNHGRAVAYMARLLGVSATVFVPAVMTPAAFNAIAAEGADVVRTDLDYDAAVAAAARFAGDHPDRELVQDTAWDGYEQVPAWIVEGYDTMLAEVDEQLGATPDLVAIPVGVGSLAQAVIAHYRRPGDHPALLSVEPDTAACVLESLLAGTSVSLRTRATVMAGLNCGTVSTTAWPLLRDGCDAAVAVTDDEALKAVSDLGRLGVSSGPSGAATLAGVRVALAQPERRRALRIDGDSTLVLLSTEGASR
ncbi:MAG TPA: diaminopropionate ammonia-lyase [Jiangellaceae bacterium]|nr:diaminopropionate ammonia-lyase [Jiangellaceae bacterium]